TRRDPRTWRRPSSCRRSSTSTTSTSSRCSAGRTRPTPRGDRWPVGIRRIRLFLVVITLLVLQTAVFTHLRIFGAVPDLLLVATIGMAYESGPMQGALFGFGAGLAQDLFLTTPLGVSALAFALTGYAVGLFQTGLIRESRSIAPLLGGVGSVVGNILFILIG